MAQNQNNRNYNGALWNKYSFRKPRTPYTENMNQYQNKPVQLSHRPSHIKKVANDFESAIANASAKTEEFAREKDRREHDQNQPSHIKQLANEFEYAMGVPAAQTKEFAQDSDGYEPCSDLPVKEIMIVLGHDNSNSNVRNAGYARNAGKPVQRKKLAETEEVVTTVMSNEGNFLGYISMVKKRVVRAVSSIGVSPSSKSRDGFRI